LTKTDTHLRSLKRYDEPEILPSSIRQICLIGADGEQSKAAADKRAELSKLTGAVFDKAYIDNEVAYHTTVNGALETTLIPSANNPELKSLLQTGLQIFQGHQQHAEQLAAGLQ
jgi:predicted outer membrane protein